MICPILIVLLISSLSFFVVDYHGKLASARRDNAVLNAQLDAALRDKHDIANSAMKGAPAIKWHRPYPIPPNADAWYWLIRSDNKKFLFTDEARKEAEQRARLLLIA